MTKTIRMKIFRETPDYSLSSAADNYSVSIKTPPKYNGVVFKEYSKYLANISEIFTTEFSTYLYILCKNLWKFKVKIVFYYTFSITHPKHK